MKPLALLVAVLGASVAFADPDITLTGPRTSDFVYEAKSDTVINLSGVTFINSRLKLSGNVVFTLNLAEGTTNAFCLGTGDAPCVKATKASDLVITGGGVLKVLSDRPPQLGLGEKEIDDGLVTCRHLTVAGGETVVVFAGEEPDTACIYLKGNYCQTAGSLEVVAGKDTSTSRFFGVRIGSKDASFRLDGGAFSSSLGGERSRAVDLRKSASALFAGGRVRADFRGPGGRFVCGGSSLAFTGGDYFFTTNSTPGVTSGRLLTDLAAVKSDAAITISGGTFRADLPLAGSEVFTNDSKTGTDITVSGGVFDLVAGDDCIHAKGKLRISGGTLRARSTCDDALDANGGIEISGGDIRAYATASETHGLDVNKGDKLKITGGVVIATDGLGATPIGAGTPDVGKVKFVQATSYRPVSTEEYSGRTLALRGVTNGVPFTVTETLPVFPEKGTFHLLTSIPGGTPE